MTLFLKKTCRLHSGELLSEGVGKKNLLTGEGADMGEYFDSSYVVADSVILFYEADDTFLQIPNHLGDMDIHSIGDGAFMESKTL